MFFNIEEALSLNIIWPDIYFTPEYGRTQQKNDSVWECYYIIDKFLYVYLIKNDTDIIPVYGYGGMYKYPSINQEEFNLLRHVFLIKIKERYPLLTTELIKKNPYISDFNLYDKLVAKKSTYGVELKDYNYYLNTTSKDHKQMVSKGHRIGYIFQFEKACIDDFIETSPFRTIYDKTMEHKKADNVYIYNTEYYRYLTLIDNIYLATVKNANQDIIGMAIFMIHTPYIHYHLSASNRESNCITNFLIHMVIKNCFDNFPDIKLLHLGGGLQPNDFLDKFKCKLSTKKFDYCIYKNDL